MLYKSSGLFSEKKKRKNNSGPVKEQDYNEDAGYEDQDYNEDVWYEDQYYNENVNKEDQEFSEVAGDQEHYQNPFQQALARCWEPVLKDEDCNEEPLMYKAEYQRHFEQERRNYEKRLQGEVQGYGGKMRPELDYSFPLHNFLVVTLAYNKDENPCGLLTRSAGFCKMPVNWDYRGTNTCIVKIEGQVVAQSAGTDKKDAREKATKKAVNILKNHCYTIEVKNQYLSDGTKVDLMDVEVNTSVGGKAESLGQSNIGHKLLSLMGWAGGGLGKEGTGRTEPVTATKLFGREGVGNRGSGKHFKAKITKIVEEWMASCSPYDLVFTTGFDNAQRKEMHEVARRFGLKSKSFGKGEDRHLTISKKQSGLTLLEELLERGGETEKYSLIPPGGGS